MNTDKRGYFDALAERVLGVVFEVSHTPGAGFLEKVYQRALLHKLLVEEVLVIESNVSSVSTTNRPRSVSIICEPRAGVCVCSSISRNPRSSGSESSTDAPPLVR
jgi:hypothetical protein